MAGSAEKQVGGIGLVLGPLLLGRLRDHGPITIGGLRPAADQQGTAKPICTRMTSE
jgi:hypothetical protein